MPSRSRVQIAVVVGVLFALSLPSCANDAKPATTPDVGDASSAGGADASLGQRDASQLASGESDASFAPSDASSSIDASNGSDTDASQSAGDGGPIDCDPRKLRCKRAQPVCPEGQVPSVVGTCYGECVPVEQCACDEAADCPDENHYTCHMFAAHCGPYV